MNGRDEIWLIGFGGGVLVFLDVESMGVFVIFVFFLDENGVVVCCYVWVCCNGVEEDIVEEWFGLVEFGCFIMWLFE